jgi:peroxiredoxin
MPQAAAQDARAATSPGDGGDPLLARLAGQPLPAFTLPSTTGERVELAELDRAVLYFYPGYVCSPEGGYDSPALDEAQPRAFARHWADFLALNCMALGVSSQSSDGQSVTSSALGVGHPLLCDGDRTLAHELGLPTFTVDHIAWYCRLTLVVDDGVIVRAFYPVTSATRSAAQALRWMRQR